MLSLQQWFGRHGVRPLALTVAVVILIQAAYLTYLVILQRTKRAESIERLRGAVSLAIEQNNRPLLDHALKTAVHELDTRQMMICRGDDVVESVPPTLRRCRIPKAGLWTIILTFQPIGLSDYVIHVSAPRFHNLNALLLAFAVSVTFLVGIALTFRRITTRVRNEILAPLTADPRSAVPTRISELEVLRQQNAEFHALKANQAVSDAMSDLAVMIAHDIRSPVAALESVMRGFPTSDGTNQELKERGDQALVRIRGIADRLLERYRISHPVEDAHHVWDLVTALVEEKKLEFRNRANVKFGAEVARDSFGLFVGMPAIELKTVLSNLINNSVEAIDGVGAVQVVVARSDTGSIALSIRDNGRGIPPEILGKVTERGATFGKPNGMGLGLFHARSSVEKWGGTLRIISTVGSGSSVDIDLPAVVSPAWFCTELKIPHGARIVVVDDDPSVQRVWEDRLREAGLKDRTNLEAVYDSTHFIRSTKRDPKAVYLVDQDFGPGHPTGIQAIERMGIAHQAVLVSGKDNDPHLAAECARLGTRMLGKRHLNCIQIVAQKITGTDVVLIDDDQMIREMWETSGRANGRTVTTFRSRDQFLSAADGLSRDVVVYVDDRLDGKERGRDVAKTVSDLGFSNVYLATGYDTDEIREVPWIKGVVGKQPPWE